MGMLRHLSVCSVFRGQARHVIEIVTLVDTASIAVYAAQHETDDPVSRCGSFNADLRSAIGECQDTCAREERRRSTGAASARIAAHPYGRVHPESDSTEQRLETPCA